MDATRPKWDWKLPERTFRELTQRHIVGVSHGWKFTSEDTSESWIVLKLKDHDKSKGSEITIRSHELPALAELMEFRPDHASLFRLTYTGEQARKRIAEIDAFEKTSDRDRREYERLKRKFEA